jgi:hypothetical protein
VTPQLESYSKVAIVVKHAPGRPALDAVGTRSCATAHQTRRTGLERSQRAGKNCARARGPLQRACLENFCAPVQNRWDRSGGCKRRGARSSSLAEGWRLRTATVLHCAAQETAETCSTLKSSCCSRRNVVSMGRSSGSCWMSLLMLRSRSPKERAHSSSCWT